jgi:hypothetical protein
MITLANHDSFGYYSASAMFINVVGYAASLASALYPKLLGEECSDKHVTTALSTMMMMAIPLATVAIILSKQLLAVLNANYIDTWPVMVMLVVSVVISLVGTFYSNYLSGTESFDIAGKISLKRLVKSKIFKVLSLSYLQAGVTIPLTYAALNLLPVSDPIRVAEYLAAIAIIMQIVYLVVIYWLSQRYAGRIFINIKEVSKYVGVAVVMGILLFLLPTKILPAELVPTNSTSIYNLLDTLLKAVVGMGIYFGLLLLIDRQARNLVKLVISELKQIFGFKTKEPECVVKN